MLYSSKVPVMPDTSEVAPGRPVYGASAATLVEACNALNGFRFVRFVQHQVPLTTYTINDKIGYAGQRLTNRVRFRPSPLTNKLWCGVWCHAAVNGATTPSISVSLRRLSTGGLIDGPVSWSGTSANLPLNPDGLSSASGATNFKDRLVRFSWSGTGTPALLDVLTWQGHDLYLEVVSVNARVYSVSMLEIAEV